MPDMGVRGSNISAAVIGVDVDIPGPGSTGLGVNEDFLKLSCEQLVIILINLVINTHVSRFCAT